MEMLQAALFAQATAAIALADFVMPLDVTEPWAPRQVDEYDHLRGEYAAAAKVATEARALTEGGRNRA